MHPHTHTHASGALSHISTRQMTVWCVVTSVRNLSKLLSIQFAGRSENYLRYSTHVLRLKLCSNRHLHQHQHRHTQTGLHPHCTEHNDELQLRKSLHVNSNKYNNDNNQQINECNGVILRCGSGLHGMRAKIVTRENEQMTKYRGTHRHTHTQPEIIYANYTWGLVNIHTYIFVKFPYARSHPHTHTRCVHFVCAESFQSVSFSPPHWKITNTKHKNAKIIIETVNC